MLPDLFHIISCSGTLTVILDPTDVIAMRQKRLLEQKCYFILYMNFREFASRNTRKRSEYPTTQLKIVSASKNMVCYGIRILPLSFVRPTLDS